MPNYSALHEEFVTIPRTAYFSMEIALRNEIHTYSGGLGVLAGDTVRSAADLELPMVAVSLVSHAGYFRQELDPRGRQIEHPDPWEPGQWARPLGAKVAVPIEGRPVWIGGWLYIAEGLLNGRQPVILLDTDLEENEPEDRTITHYLYGGDKVYRLKQEIVLGIGGVRLLYALGFRLNQFHLNEGHSALLTLELLRRHAYPPDRVRPGESRYDIPLVRQLCNFTTHTPVEAGHDVFSYTMVQEVLGELIDLPTLKLLGGADNLNMTRLAINLSEYINGVAKSHAATSTRMFPGYSVRSVTNGVHPYSWTCPSMARLYDARLSGWCHEPELLVRADQIPDEAIWDAHSEAKQRLLTEIQARCGTTLDPDKPILGFARRMTAYKRPDLLFADLARLKRIAEDWPLQIVVAGKAHPRDTGGKALIELLHRCIEALKPTVPMVYLPNYDIALALNIVSGVDLWLNTPLPPLEASGTSGMKAALNGVPNLSVLDGWWVEGCIEGITGWSIGGSLPDQDADDLYEKLERVVLPLYYKDHPGWLRVMKGAISKNASFFNSHRMMRRYVAEAYSR